MTNTDVNSSRAARLVRQALFSANPEIELEKLASDENYEVRHYVAMHTTSPTTLQLLCSDQDASVRLQVANNWSSPASALAKDDNFFVREKVATNLSSPAEALEILSGDAIEAIRFDAIQHKNMPPMIKAEHYADKYLKSLESHEIPFEQGIEALKRRRAASIERRHHIG